MAGNAGELKIEISADALDAIKALNDFQKGTESSGDSALKMGDLIKANLISDAIIGGLKALGDMMLNAGKAAIDLAKEGVELAASQGEVNAAFEQVAGTDLSAMEDGLNALASTTGITTSRLKKDFTTQVAGWKGIGKTTEEATALAGKSMGLGADYAAFYGLSAEEAIGKINSFANGNMNAAESLGISTNAAQIASWASQNLGVDFNKLEESEKKIIRLKFVEEMSNLSGVTGQAARESGGFENVMANMNAAMGAAKATLGNELLPGVLGITQAFTGLVDGSMSTEQAMALVENSFVDLSVGLVGIMEEMLPKVIDMVVGLIPEISRILLENMPLIIDAAGYLIESLIKGINEAIPYIMPVIMMLVYEITEEFIDNLPLIIQSGITLIVSLIKGITEMLPKLIPLMIDAVLLIADTIIDNIDMLIDAGIDLIFALADGLIENLPALMQKAPTIVQKLVDAVVRNAPKLLQAAGELVGKLATGLLDALPGMVQNGFKMVISIKDGLLEGIGSLYTVGKQLLEGLWNGINDKKDWIIGKVKSIGGSILDGIKGFFGIKSPSRLFEDEIGNNLMLGIAEGMENGQRMLENVALQSASVAFEPFDYNMPNGTENTTTGSYGGITQNVTINSPRELSPSEIGRKTKQAARELSFEWGLA